MIRQSIRSILISILFLWPLTSGCDRGNARDEGTSRPQRPIDVTATVYPMADVARQIGGSNVEVSWFVEGGQSLAGFQPDAKARNRLRGAAIVITAGASEPWASEGITDPFQRQRLLRLDVIPTARGWVDTDGLLWLDPVIVREAAHDLAERLVILRPERTRFFREREQDFAAKIDQLVADFRDRLSHAIVKRILVVNNDFNPMLARFGLEVVSPITASPTALSDSDLAALQRAAAEQNTRLLIVSSDTPDAVVLDLERRTRFQIVQIDTLGSSAPGGHDTYLDLMKFDLDQLLRATGVP